MVSPDGGGAKYQEAGGLFALRSYISYPCVHTQTQGFVSGLNRGNAYQRRCPDFIHGTIVAGRFYLLFFRFPGIGRVIQEVRREVVYCRMLPGMLFKPLDTAGNAPADGVAARPVKEW